MVHRNIFQPIFTKGDNAFDILFASLGDETVPKRGPAYRSKLFHSVDSY